MNKPAGVLIIDGHVQALALTRSLGEKGTPVYIADRNRFGIARFSSYCKKFFQCPEYLSDAFPEFLIRLAEKENLKEWLILACDDHIVYALSKNKERLKRYFKIMSVDFDILQNIISKKALFEKATQAGIPVIPTFYPQNLESLKDIPEGFRFPLIIKGIEGQSFYRKTGAKAFKVEDNNGLHARFSEVCRKMEPQELMIQEMIPLTPHNKVVSFAGFCENGKLMTHWIGHKIREHPIYFGTATCSKSIALPALADPSQKLLRILNFDGPCEIEYIQDPRDGLYYLIEINPRTWLWVGLAKECGVDFAWLVYNYMHGLPNDYPQSYKTPVVWQNEITDFVFTSLNLLKGKIRLQDLFKNRKLPKVSALRYKKDMKPFWAYLFLMPYIFFKRG